MLVSRDGSFAAYDGVKQAFLRFSRSGEYVMTVSASIGVDRGGSLTASTNAGEVYRASRMASGSIRENERITLDSS